MMHGLCMFKNDAIKGQIISSTIDTRRSDGASPATRSLLGHSLLDVFKYRKWQPASSGPSDPEAFYAAVLAEDTSAGARTGTRTMVNSLIRALSLRVVMLIIRWRTAGG